MSSVIPNLWPDDLVPEEVRTPKEILEFQAEQLSEASRGLVRGEVVSQNEDSSTAHFFNLVASELGGYRYRLLTVIHDRELAYPCRLYTQVPMSAVEMIDLDQTKLLESLGRVFGDQSTRSILQALAAKVGEQRRIRNSAKASH